MRLLLFHPKFAGRTCESCIKHIYDADGELKRYHDGRPMLRPRGTILPCAGCPKIPKGADPSPRNAEELTDRLWIAYAHYRRCRAVGRWPDDPIVERNAAIIRDVEDEAEAMPLEKLSTLLLLRK